MALNSLICSKCNNRMQPNDQYCPTCGNINKSSMVQKQHTFLFFDDLSFTAFFAGLIFPLLMMNSDYLFISLNDFQYFMLYILPLLMFLTLIIILVFMYFITNHYFINIPNLPIKKVIFKSYSFILIGTIFGNLINYYITRPIFNVLFNIGTTPTPGNILSIPIDLVFNSIVFSIFSLFSFFSILYIIQINESTSQKLSIKTIFSGELTRICFILGLIMGSVSLINQSIINNIYSEQTILYISFTFFLFECFLLIYFLIIYFRRSNSELWRFENLRYLLINFFIIFSGFATILVVYVFLSILFNPSFEFKQSYYTDLLNSLNSAVIVWVLLVSVLFVKYLYIVQKMKPAKAIN